MINSPHTKQNGKTDKSVTRRDFVKKSAGAAATVPFILSAVSSNTLAATAASLSSSAYLSGSDIIKVGLIGCGGRGSGAATQALNADPGVVITALADAFTDRLNDCYNNLTNHAPDRVKVDEEHKFIGLDAYQKLINTDVDVVLLATPPCFRPDHLIAAATAGKHIFCEKPMAIDGPGVRKVLQAAAIAKQKDISLVCGFCWRYNLPNRAVFSEIHNGRIGAIRAIYTTYLTSPIWIRKRQPGWTDADWQLRNWPHFTYLGGDHIVEQAVHSIDKMAWAMNGELPVRAVAVGGRIARGNEPERGNVYDHFGVTYEYASGVRGFHSCRQIEKCWGDNTDYIMGEKGISHINSWSPPHKILGENPWEYVGENPNMYQVEHNELFASIRSGNHKNDGVWMAHSTMHAILGRMAAYSGQAVTWDEALNSQTSLMPNLEGVESLPMPPVAIPGVYKIV